VRERLTSALKDFLAYYHGTDEQQAELQADFSGPDGLLPDAEVRSLVFRNAQKALAESWELDGTLPSAPGSVPTSLAGQVPDAEEYRSTFSGIVQGNCEGCGDCSDDENGECACDRIVNELIAAIERINEEAAPQPTAGGDAPWKCNALVTNYGDPKDCNWPYCGCDPHAERVMKSAREQGWYSPGDFEEAEAEHKDALSAERARVIEMAQAMQAELAAAGVRSKLDDREGLSPGFKFNDWEMRGVPLRVEIGPRDVEQGQVVFARRDVPGREGKTFAPREGLAARVGEMLETIQGDLLARARRFRDENIYDATTYAELLAAVDKGFARAYWCGDSACEDKLKEETKATTRCIPFEQPGGSDKCIVCGKKAEKKIYFARAY